MQTNRRTSRGRQDSRMEYEEHHPFLDREQWTLAAGIWGHKAQNTANWTDFIFWTNLLPALEKNIFDAYFILDTYTIQK